MPWKHKKPSATGSRHDYNTGGGFRKQHTYDMFGSRCLLGLKIFKHPMKVIRLHIASIDTRNTESEDPHQDIIKQCLDP